jgi:hypothetical protein
MLSAKMPFASKNWFGHIFPVDWASTNAGIGIGAFEIRIGPPRSSDYIEIAGRYRGVY